VSGKISLDFFPLLNKNFADIKIDFRENRTDLKR